MALIALESVSAEELDRLIRDSGPGYITWVNQSSWFYDLVSHPRRETPFRWCLARPRTDDMRQMLDDLGIEAPPVIEWPTGRIIEWSTEYVLDDLG